MKKAIIVGHTGQDGTCLSSLLLSHGYEVTGFSTNSVSENKYSICKIDIRKYTEVQNAIKNILPNEVYFLAAIHQSSADIHIEDGELFQKSFDLNVKAYINFLEAIRLYSPKTKIFYAASSHIFGNPSTSPQNESTPLNPNCIYGITKTAGIRIGHFYKENHAIFSSVGIFYNHESPLRESKYVSKKIVETVVAIKQGKKNELILGNLESQIDWGYAPDYMKAVYQMMRQEKSDDFIISSGELHTIKDFAEGVFDYLGLDCKKYVKVNPSLITKKQKQNLFGNNRKIQSATGWTPSVSFNELIKILVDAEIKKDGSK